MDYPDDVAMEDLDADNDAALLSSDANLDVPTALSDDYDGINTICEVTLPDSDVITTNVDVTVPFIIDVKEEIIEECELVTEETDEDIGDEELINTVKAEVEEGTDNALLINEVEEGTDNALLINEEKDRRLRRSRTLKQVQEIVEENDKDSYAQDFEKYLETESSDKAAIHATVHKQKIMLASGAYLPGGFSVCEMFPKKDYTSYFLIMDGQRIQLNTKKGKGCMFRCKNHMHGCGVRYRLEPGFIGKVNQHSCQNKIKDLNFNYCCIYCNMAFLDLQERKDHVMNVPHFNAPWPMDEELCLFADFTAIGTGSGEIEEACDTIKYPDEVIHKLLPNKDDVGARFFINTNHAIAIRRPRGSVPPDYPKPQLYPFVPPNTPNNKRAMLTQLIGAGIAPGGPHGEVNCTETVSSDKRRSIRKEPECQVSNFDDDKSSDKTADIVLKIKNTKKHDSTKSKIKHNEDLLAITSAIISQKYKRKQQKHTVVQKLDFMDDDKDPDQIETVGRKKSNRQFPKDMEDSSGQFAQDPDQIKTVGRKMSKRQFPKDMEDSSGQSAQDPDQIETVGRKISNKQCPKDMEDSSGQSAPSTNKLERKDDEIRSVPQRIENVIEEYENKVVLQCELCDVELNSLKQRADHDLSEEHQENKRRVLEENEKSRASLAFDKPIFTEEFLTYNKALEAELRGLRKGAVELEEQNAVLSSHISELTDVVKELRNAKLMMQKHHSTLDGHLKDLKSELSKVFAAVLSTEVSAENFNETFNKLSVAVTGKGGGKRAFDGVTTKLKRHLKQARIDTVAL